MASPKATPYQQSVSQARVKELDAAWEASRRSLFVNNRQPTRRGGGYFLLVTGVGVAFLVAAVRLLLAGKAFPRGALVFGLVLAPAGLWYAVRFFVNAARYRAAERDYLRKREAIRLEDCPRQPAASSSRPGGFLASSAAGDDLLRDE
jgi:hypothetical protein